MKVKLKCDQCKKVFEVKDKRKNTAKYCSIQCYTKSGTRFRNREFTKEYRGKISTTKLGSKNPQWKGGISQSYYQRISSHSLEQKCSVCNSKKYLRVHHLDENRENNLLSNLTILCQKCHLNIHREREVNLVSETEKESKV